MTHVEVPSRLHFGLLSLPVGGEHWDDGLPRRQFGGVGLMIDSPQVAVSASPARGWSARGPSARRALEFGRRFAATLPEALAFAIDVEAAPEEHTGLGSGTALALAVAKAIALETGHGDWPATELAPRVGRGERSAVGIHGFDRGGLIVEAGKLPNELVAPLAGSYEFPSEWRIVLARPAGVASWHGERERDAFANLTRCNPTEALCRIVLTELLPALAAKDLDGFGEALHQYNARAGEAFAAAQGGVYVSPEVMRLVALLRKAGIRGAGQSSWGPTVFAVVGGELEAKVSLDRVKGDTGVIPASLTVAHAAERGARVIRK
jgi:beta-RFAP synthase